MIQSEMVRAGADEELADEVLADEELADEVLADRAHGEPRWPELTHPMRRSLHWFRAHEMSGLQARQITPCGTRSRS